MKLQGATSKILETSNLSGDMRNVTRISDVNEQDLNERCLHVGHIKEKLLLVQNIKELYEIRNFAASDINSWLPDSRKAGAIQIGRKKDPTTKDLSTLEAALHAEYIALFGREAVAESITWSISEVLNKLNKNQIKTNPTFVSELMDVVNDKYTAGIGCNRIGSNSRVNAAKALRIMVEKIGEELHDESVIIKSLIEASLPLIRQQGALAARNSYKHKWRVRLDNVGLILALKKEEDDGIREILSHTIALASPVSILKNHTIENSSEVFCPITRIASDRSYGVRRNLLWGIATLIESQFQRGAFYTTFNESPKLTSTDKISCLDHCLKNIERLCKSDSPNPDELSLLYNSCYVLHHLANDELLNNSESNIYTSYQRVQKRLSEVNIAQFVKLVTLPVASNPKLNTWNLAHKVVETMLFLKLNNTDNPLNYLLQLRENLGQLDRGTTEPQTKSNLENAINSVDNVMSNYLNKTSTLKIMVSYKSDFNVFFFKALDLLNVTKNDSLKISIINFIDSIVPAKSEKYKPFTFRSKNRLSEQDISKIKGVLRNIIYSKPLPLNILLSATQDSPVSMALNLYRKASFSFEDYFGMSRLKEDVIKFSHMHMSLEYGKSSVVNDSKQVGFIFSGLKGSGKSSFAVALANEIGVPLEVLMPSKFQFDEGNNIFIETNKNLYSMEEYYCHIEKIGRCILLVDEIDEIPCISERHFLSKFLDFLTKMSKENLPVIVIGTTNHPILKNSFRLQIDSSGNSNTLDRQLSEYIPSEIYPFLCPNYLFQKKSVIEEFTKSYLEDLITRKKIDTEIDISKVSRLARVLTPLKIINHLNRNIKSHYFLKDVYGEIKKLRLESGVVKKQESVIRTIVDILSVSARHNIIEEPIDYLELSLVAEDLPANIIVDTIKSITPPYNQIKLLNQLKLISDEIA